MYIPEAFGSTWPESLGRIKKMIATMTLEEKQAPNTIGGARIEEIASKSGVPMEEICALIANFLAFGPEVGGFLERISESTFWQRINVLVGITSWKEFLEGPNKSQRFGNSIHA